MTDGQTELMQQVVDRSSSSIAGLFGIATDASGRLQPRDQLRDTADAAVPGSRLPRISVKHVGRFVQDAGGQPAVGELVTLLLHRHRDDALDSFVDDILARGLPVEHIYLRLFQPAARRLGELWADDICSFVDVTLGMARLQGSLRRLAPQFQRHGRSADGSRSALLASLRNDQHTFGMTMAAEFFRRSGWSVRCFGADDADDMANQLADERHAVVGFTASRLDQIPELKGAIRRLRRDHRDTLAGILVGGPLFVTHPECAREVGADAVGLDARQALAEAEILASAVGDRR